MSEPTATNPASHPPVPRMSKRKLDKFLQNYTADEIVDALRKPNTPYRAVQMRLKMLDEGLIARSTAQLRWAFDYLLREREWQCGVRGQFQHEHVFFLAVMDYLRLQSRSHVRFLPTKPFLEAFEQIMLDVHFNQARQYMEERGGSIAACTSTPAHRGVYDEGYQSFLDQTMAFDEWSQLEEGKDAIQQYKNYEKLRGVDGVASEDPTQRNAPVNGVKVVAPATSHQRIDSVPVPVPVSRTSGGDTNKIDLPQVLLNKTLPTKVKPSGIKGPSFEEALRKCHTKQTSVLCIPTSLLAPKKQAKNTLTQPKLATQHAFNTKPDILPRIADGRSQTSRYGTGDNAKSSRK